LKAVQEELKTPGSQEEERHLNILKLLLLLNTLTEKTQNW